MSGGRVRALRSGRGEIDCEAVVSAAGMGSPALLGLLGRPLPLQAGKGYSFSVGLEPGVAPHPLFRRAPGRGLAHRRQQPFRFDRVCG
ncbi:hypothetical protein [Streptomyces griseorubiginosus]|uniref:hypothetical protein n=1 Tax=Streptomyces griseorubiginosus TaxID=67304 RepID=UPI002E81FF32|nr:hypothetical protein [Streptomyces griseorubiginosus]